MNLGVALDWYRLEMAPIPAELLREMNRIKKRITDADKARAELATVAAEAITRGDIKSVQFGRWLNPDGKYPSQAAKNFLDAHLPDPE